MESISSPSSKLLSDCNGCCNTCRVFDLKLSYEWRKDLFIADTWNRDYDPSVVPETATAKVWQLVNEIDSLVRSSTMAYVKSETAYKETMQELQRLILKG